METKTDCTLIENNFLLERTKLIDQGHKQLEIIIEQTNKIIEVVDKLLEVDDSFDKLEKFIQLKSLLKKSKTMLLKSPFDRNDEIEILIEEENNYIDNRIDFIDIEIEKIEKLNKNSLIKNDMELKEKIELTMLRNQDENIDYNSDESIYYKTKFEEIRAVSLNGNKNPMSEATFIDLEIEYFNQLFKELKPLRKFNDITLVQNFISYLENKKIATQGKNKTKCKLSTPYSEQCLSDIHRYLTTPSQGIQKLTTSLDNWLARFDLKNIDNIEFMKWNATKTMLSNIMLKVCGSEQNSAIKEAFNLDPTVKLTPDSKEKFNNSTVGIAIQSIIDKHKQQSN